MKHEPARELIRDALIIDEPWLSRILDGDKTWELRTSHCHKRGWVALIRKGSGLVVGMARVAGSRGPLSSHELEAGFSAHRVPIEVLRQKPTYRFAWELSGARRLSQPVRYTHPAGAVKWVTLAAEVSRELAAELVAEPSRLLPEQSATPVQPAATDQLGSTGSLAQVARPVAGVDSTAITGSGGDAGAESLVALPVAKDGTSFGPHCQCGGGYTIGPKGAELKYVDFYQARDALLRFATPRWRRRNASGNWGIVSGVRWTKVTRSSLDAALAEVSATPGRSNT